MRGAALRCASEGQGSPAGGGFFPTGPDMGGQTGPGMMPSWNVTFPTRMQPFMPGRQ